MSYDEEPCGFDRITPTSVSLTAKAAAPSPQVKMRRLVRHGAGLRPTLTGAALLLLCAAAGGVIVVLPKWVGPVRPPDPVPVAASAAAARNADGAPASDPSRAAAPDPVQQARLRLASQDALAQMLELQRALQQVHAESWTPDAYAAGLADGDAGQEAYRTQQFDQARVHYLSASALFRVLLEQSGQIFANAVRRGDTALREGDSAAAAQAFETALLIRPTDAAAAKGVRRARVLDEVNALVAKGDDLRERGELPQAREAYQHALHLDPEAATATAGVEQVARMQADRDFTRAMSAGYAALQGDDLESARRAFTAALKVKPSAADATNALSLAEHRQTAVRLAGLLEQGARLKQNGRWEQAASTYEAALAVDPSLVPAQQGRMAAAQRASLDARLAKTIAQPERLANPALYREAGALLDQARRIGDPDERLKQQISELSALLEKSVIPLPVQLQSDNSTEVTIYKVAPLGRFGNKELSLRPGHYVAVGKRPGYRDVRVEFTVTPDHQMPPVVLRCTEKIA